jgi:hypothetical protein
MRLYPHTHRIKTERKNNADVNLTLCYTQQDYSTLHHYA